MAKYKSPICEGRQNRGRQNQGMTVKRDTTQNFWSVFLCFWDTVISRFWRPRFWRPSQIGDLYFAIFPQFWGFLTYSGAH